MRERDIFIAALQQDDPSRQAAVLDRECGADAILRQRVEQLLADHERQESFILDRAPAGFESDATVQQSPASAVGMQLGPYKLLQQIGEGGMGVVYLAEQGEPVRRTVAFKIIKPGMDTRQVVARFEAERQALALMDHPNIAKVLDAGAIDSGRPYFVMELVKGMPITEYCDAHHLSLDDRLALFLPVCQAVQHAHQKGIIHRDLKPSNVMIALYDGRPVPKVIDFGVAKATGSKLTERTLFTEFGAVVGTLEYMSPEQAEVNQLDVDTRSDIYSLGVLLYELLTGSTPLERKRFMATALQEVLRVIREEDPPTPSTRISRTEQLPQVAAARGLEPQQLSGMVRGELDWIVMKALEKDRNRRYETANGLLRDIERYLADEPVQACPPSAAYRFCKFARRNRGLLIAGGAVAAALVVGLGLSTWLFFRARAALRVAKANEARATAEAAKSQQVAQFMTDMLKGVGPAVAVGRDTTMLREILDQTAQRLNDLKSQPAVEADLRATLGNVYSDLGEYTSAVTMHSDGLALRTKLLGEEHPDVATAINNIAEVLYRQGKWPESVALHRKALAMRRKFFGNEDADVAASLNSLAEALRQQRKFEEAEPLFRAALTMRRKLLGSNHADVAQSLNDLGLLLWNREQNVAAEAMHREALAIRRRLFGNEHPDVATSLDRLGLALEKQRKYADAEAVHREALALRRKVLGDEHPDLAHSLHNMATVHFNQGKRAEAEAKYREALAMRRKLLGNGHKEVGDTLRRLAELLRGEGKLDEAEAMCREALDVYERALGSEHIVLARTLHELGWIIVRQGKPAEAEAIYREALAMRIKQLGQKHSEVASALPDLARVLSLQGKRDEAEVVYLEAIEMSPRNAGLCNKFAWDLATHANLRFRDPPLAVKLATRAVELTPKDGGVWNTLGVAQYRAGDWQAAATALEKSTELRNGGDCLEWFFLAMAQWQLGHKEEARNWYAKAVAQMEKNDPNVELRRFRHEATVLLGAEPKTQDVLD